MSDKVKNRLMIAGAAFCAALFLFSGAMLFREYLDQKQNAEAFDEVAELVKEDVELPTLELADDSAPEPEELTAFEKYADVYAQNSDLVGWISIPGTRIDYPVMQTKDNPNFYLIMGNGTQAYAIPAQQESHIKTAEMSTEQNYNMIDGTLNNAPSMGELEARAKAGEQISLFDVAEAAKAEAQKPKQTRTASKTAQRQKKPSIRAQLKAAKEEQAKKPPAREKSKELEV